MRHFNFILLNPSTKYRVLYVYGLAESTRHLNRNLQSSLIKIFFFYYPENLKLPLVSDRHKILKTIELRCIFNIKINNDNPIY